MDKSFLLTVGITCILMGMVYLFMKQKFVIYDEKITSLFSVVQTMADELQKKKSCVCPFVCQAPSELANPDTMNMRPATRPVPTIISVSDDSQSEDDSSSESDSEPNTDFDLETTKIVVVKTEPEEARVERFNVNMVDAVDYSNQNMRDIMENMQEIIGNVNFLNIISPTEPFNVNMVVDVVDYSNQNVREMNETVPDVVEYSMDDVINEPVVKEASATKEYSSMTVKELKKLVSEKGGPYMKVKTDLVYYLENTH